MYICDSLTGVKGKFYAALHTFIAEMTYDRFKKLGLTVIYLPMEGLELSVEEACDDKGLVERLENVMMQWTGQIKVTLADGNQDSALKCTYLEEISDFWIRHCQYIAPTTFFFFFSFEDDKKYL